MTPVYGFLEGDTLGILLLASPDETLAALAARLEQAARVRVAPRGGLEVVIEGRVVDGGITVRESGLGALGRFDVVRPRGG